MENVVSRNLVWMHEYSELHFASQHWSWNVYHFCAMQNLDDCHLFYNSLGTTILVGAMESTDCTHVGRLALFRTHLEQSRQLESVVRCYRIQKANVFIGTMAVIIEVTLSGFASIYFEKVIKTDSEQLGIWERNFQLALGSFPIYLAFMIYDGGSKAGYAGGWSPVAWVLALLGAAGGLLVALSIKYGDSILKTLATTGAICLSSLLDHFWLGGPLTPVMVIAGFQVIIAICNYTFDTTPVEV